jgi:hypothetical protein
MGWSLSLVIGLVIMLERLSKHFIDGGFRVKGV